MTKLLHIGLGKCGSTFLQNEIFPSIEKKINTNYINLHKNNFFNVNKSQKFISKFINPSNNIFFKIKNKILSQFLLRQLFQNKIDKLLPYKKYYINRKFIYLDIDSEIRKYNLLKT